MTTKTSNNRRARAAKRDPLREVKLLLLLGIPIVVVAALAAYAITSTQQQSATQTLAAADSSQFIRPDSPILGESSAPVTLVEFLDPECEGCRAAYPIVKDLLADYNGQVRLVVRYIPRHNNSIEAVAATEAAGRQGKYWEMQELLFANQPEWGEQTTPQTDAFVRYATQLGLDIEQFTRDLQDPAFEAKAKRDLEDGTALGVQGTPTFFVEQQLVEPLSEETLRQMIDARLAAQSAP